MRALVLEQFGGPFIPKDVPTPAIAPHEALVRVRNVGVCGTDVKIRANRATRGGLASRVGYAEVEKAGATNVLCLLHPGGERRDEKHSPKADDERGPALKRHPSCRSNLLRWLVWYL